MSYKTEKLFLILIFLSIFIVAYSQESTTHGTSSPTCDTRISKIIQCDPQSCGTLLTCFPGEATPHKITKCNKDSPYCNTGRYEDYCSDVMESTGVHCYQIGAFSCTKPGLYPNVMDCQSYYYCNGDEVTVLPRFCPPGYYFNARTFTCGRLLSQAQCYRAKCTERGMFPYVRNSQLFYTCAETSSSLFIPAIHRCDAKETFRNNACTYLCWISGRFAHEDPTRYYECYLSGPRLAYLIRSCGSKTFNPVLRRCNYY